MAATLYVCFGVYAVLVTGVPAFMRRAAAVAQLAFLVVAVMVDSGAALDKHGAYNIAGFLVMVGPAYAMVACCRALYLRCTLRQLAGAAGVAVLVAWAYQAGTMALLRPQWLKGVAGARMLTAERDGWPGCDWPSAGVSWPLYDIVPQRLMTFWLGSKECPAPAAGFEASLTLEVSTADATETLPSGATCADWGSLSDEAAARSRSAGGKRAAATTHAPNADGIPVRLRVACPRGRALSYTILPDTRLVDHARKDDPYLQQHVIDESVRVDVPDSERDGGDVYEAVEKRRGETFVVRCGDDTRYISINRCV
jgi:hypothetical protein